jgi:hypothetical protein
MVEGGSAGSAGGAYLSFSPASAIPGGTAAAATVAAPALRTARLFMEVLLSSLSCRHTTLFFGGFGCSNSALLTVSGTDNWGFLFLVNGDLPPPSRRDSAGCAGFMSTLNSDIRSIDETKPECPLLAERCRIPSTQRSERRQGGGLCPIADMSS